MKDKKRKKRLMTFLLVYFAIFTSFLSLITLSKYSGTSQGDGNSSIAKWDVSLDTSDNNSDTLNIIKGTTTQNYILKINSTSDIKAVYSVELDDLPSGLEVSIDGTNFQTPVNNKITFENIGIINANAEQKTASYTLSFRAPTDSEVLDENLININVVFKQVNPATN